ncbi:MAG: putative ATP-binding protein involved in virulence [Phenylobacterium sp.]|jgi:predicted ATP-binding protein involved in virulence
MTKPDTKPKIAKPATKQSKAIRPLQQNAKKGDVSAMFELHQKYASGQDVDLDENKANDYFNQCLNYLNATKQQNEFETPINRVLLNKLKLIDFRKFSSLDVTFDPKLTVFIGNNGAGKTTIADAIAKTFSWINARIETKGRSSRPINEADINIHSQHYAEVSTSISLGDTHYESSLARSIKGAESNKNSYLESLRNFSDIYRVVNDKQRQQQQPEINIPLFAYYSVERSHTKSTQTFDIEKLKDIDPSSRFDALDSSALGGSGNFKQFLEWFITLDNLINASPQAQSETLKRDINALEAVVTSQQHALSSLLEEKKALYQTIIDQQSTGQQQRRIKLHSTIKQSIIKTVPDVSQLFVDRTLGRAELKINIDDNEINVFQASHGQQILISLIADITRRLVLLNPQLDNPTHGQGIVLIDEIELHLHPKWQQGIIQSLQRTFANIQFIITTHSPQVLSTVDKHCIRRFETDEADNDILTIPKFQTKGVTSADILAKIMDTDPKPVVDETSWLNQFYAHLQEGDKTAAEKLLTKLCKHFTSDDHTTDHPVIEDCRNQIKIFEMKARMRQMD